VIFFHVEKSKRRRLVLVERTTSHTAGHTMKSLEVLCETDSPQLVPWLLSRLDDQRGLLFARLLLEAAAHVGEGEPILAKDVPDCLYCTGFTVPTRRLRWDELKAAIACFSLASRWHWTLQDQQAASDIKAAFAAFHAAREGKR